MELPSWSIPFSLSRYVYFPELSYVDHEDLMRMLKILKEDVECLSPSICQELGTVNEMETVIFLNKKYVKETIIKLNKGNIFKFLKLIHNLDINDIESFEKVNEYCWKIKSKLINSLSDLWHEIIFNVKIKKGKTYIIDAISFVSYTGDTPLIKRRVVGILESDLK